MLKKNGIMLKTFLFTSALITFVVIISFGILYFAMPSHYLSEKTKTLQKNSDILVDKLNNAETDNDCAELIDKFISDNNAVVLSYDSGNNVLPLLSSPFMSVTISTSHDIFVAPNEDTAIPESTEAKKVDNISVRRDTTNDIEIIKTIDSDFIDHIVITGSLQPIDEAKDVVLSLMPILLILDIAIALIFAFLYSKRITKPILSISKAAAQMQKMVPGATSDIQTNDEIGELARNLDFLYESLCANIEDLQYKIKVVHQLEQSKTDFMRAASHELKTPIAALNGLVEGMIDNVGVYKNKETYLRQSKVLIDKLSSLVNEILIASTMEKIEDSICIETVSVSDILRKTIDEYRLLAKEKNLLLSVEANEYLYDTDRNMIRNVFSNLVSNAIRYTETGSEIHVILRPEGDGAVFSIENPCADIAEDELDKLFEPFYSLSYSRHKRESGTGLGLYITKKTLERLKICHEMKKTPIGLKISLYFKEPTAN